MSEQSSIVRFKKSGYLSRLFRAQYIKHAGLAFLYDAFFLAASIMLLAKVVMDQDGSSYSAYWSKQIFLQIMKTQFCEFSTKCLSIREEDDPYDYDDDAYKPFYDVQYSADCLEHPIRYASSSNADDYGPDDDEYQLWHNVISMPQSHCFSNMTLSSFRVAECSGMSYTMGWLVGVSILLSVVYLIVQNCRRSCYSDYKNGSTARFGMKREDFDSEMQPLTGVAPQPYSKVNFSYCDFIVKNLLHLGFFCFALSSVFSRVSDIELDARDCLTRAAACNFCLVGASNMTGGLELSSLPEVGAKDHPFTTMQTMAFVGIVGLWFAHSFGLSVFRHCIQCVKDAMTKKPAARADNERTEGTEMVPASSRYGAM